MIDADDSLTDPRTLFHVDPVRWRQVADRRSREIPQHIAYIQGHIPATKYDDVFKNRFVFTWLRDPFERAISHYFFWRTLPPEGHMLHDYICANNLSFSEFIELPLLQNVMTRLFFPGDSFDLVDFCGFNEDFENDWFALCSRLGVEQAPPVKLRSTAYPAEYYEVLSDRRIKARFFSLNREDYALWDTARRIHKD